jgi:hypothetical protein
MPLKLKRFSEGVWYDYRGARFKIRAATPNDYLRLQDMATEGKVAVKLPDGTTQIVDNDKKGKFYRSIFDYILEDFSEVELEGTSNKDEIKEGIFNDRDVRDFIMAKSNELSARMNADLDEELKNSGTLQSGSP